MDETKNFNSHAHVERDDRVRKMVVEFEISTHTLTWSVTFLLCHPQRARLISTHTLTWSVTVDRRETRPNAEFQLTRSRGA